MVDLAAEVEARHVDLRERRTGDRWPKMREAAPQAVGANVEVADLNTVLCRTLDGKALQNVAIALDLENAFVAGEIGAAHRDIAGDGDITADPHNCSISVIEQER